MGRKFSYYPYYDSNKFFEKIYHKKEYYINRQKYINPEKPPQFEEVCRVDGQQKFELLPQQRLLRNYINPATPYQNILIFHETGVGKSLSALSISESYRNYFKQLWMTTADRRPQIYIVASREAQNNFIRELINRFQHYVSSTEKAKLERLFQQGRLEEYELFLKELKERLSDPSRGGFYKFVGYKKFQNQTIGAKFRNIEKKLIRDVEGDIQRRQIGKPIDNLNDSILIIDEAHNIEDNDYGEAVEEIIARSKNLRVILLTATPMKLRAVEIIQLMNFILPSEKKLKKEKIFGKDGKILSEGLNDLKQKVKGYVSFLRSQPFSFPKRIDEGKLVNSAFKYTKLIPCPMSSFHYATYEAFYDGKNTPESRKLMDMVLPNPRHLEEKKDIGIYKTDDINNLIGSASPKWLEEKGIEPIIDNEGKVIITGSILLAENLKKYSNKFYQLLQNLKRALRPDYGAVFIYNEQIEGIGLKLLLNILVENGFDPYNSKITPEANLRSHQDDRSLCVFCGKSAKEHHSHPFYSAKVAVLMGETDMTQRSQIIRVINEYANKDGRYIKIILGSAIIKESIDFKRLREVHIVNFNEDISTTEQIIGRAIRHCSHIGLPEKDRNVRIYRYVSSLPSRESGLSGEELRYLGAEKEHIEIKKVERALKESAFDCALNKFGNVFEEEVENYQHPPYPSFCDYQPCQYKCLWEPETIVSSKYLVKKFKELSLKDLDLDTYTVNMAGREILMIKETLKNLFSRELALKIEDIVRLVKQDIVGFERELIEEKYIYISLQEMMDNLTAFINNYGILGYITYRGEFYVFQPLNILNNSINLLERLRPSMDPEEVGMSIIPFLDLDQPSKVITSATLKEILIIIEKDGLTEELINQIPLKKQIAILEDAIEKQKIKSIYKKIIEYYHPYLITQKDLEKASFSYDDLSQRTEFVGHLLSPDGPRCLTDEGHWEKCQIDFIRLEDRLKKQKENDIIIGFIDKNRSNRFVFKLRPPMDKTKGVRDRRTLEQGYVCNRTSDKKKIESIAQKLEIKFDPKKLPIRDICNLIEKKLKKLDSPKLRYFYTYLEVLAQKDKK